MFHDHVSIEVQQMKIESLLPLVSDVMRKLGSSAHPTDYMRLLESVYGLVEDDRDICQIPEHKPRPR